MRPDKIPEIIDKFLDDESKGLSPDLLGWLKQQFEANIHQFIGENIGKLRLGLVIDTNVAIQAITYYSKGKPSILFHLEKNPIFPIYAPVEIEEEISKYIHGEAKTKKNYNKEKLEEGWSKLKKILTIKDVVDKKIREKAINLIGKRDPCDVPFVSLFIEVGAVAILTEDHHYDNLSIQKFSIRDLDKIVATSHRGVYSFFLYHDIVPKIFELLAKLVVNLLKVIFQFFMFLFKIMKSLAKGAIDRVGKLLSKIPPEVGIMALLLGILGVVLLAHDKDLRGKITSPIKSAWKQVKIFLEKIISWLLDTTQTLVGYTAATKPYVGVSLTALTDIYQNITKLSEEIKKLYQDSAYFA